MTHGKRTRSCGGIVHVRRAPVPPSSPWRSDSWNGACYRPVDDGTIRAQIWDFLDRAVVIGRDGSTAPFLPNQSRVNNVIDALAAVSNLPGHVIPPTWLLTRGNEPSAAEMLPVANGLLHLPSGKLHLATPAFFGLNACNLRYDPDASAPQRWLGFLSEVFGDDIEAIETLQETMGYALTPDTSQQKILLMVGPTRCGKGTIARTLTELVGRDNVAAPTLASLSTNFGLAPLIGKPLAIIADARLGSRSDPAAIAERLLSVSGEDALTIDRKFQPAWTGRLPTRFVVLTNELPRLVDASGALAKRFVVLTMQRSFLGREDHGLTGKLLAELPGILNWDGRDFCGCGRAATSFSRRARRGHRGPGSAGLADWRLHQGMLRGQAGPASCH